MWLPGTIDFSIERRGSFFNHYRLQTDDFTTLILMDDNEEIQGVATLVFHQGMVLGERQVFAYATDLRIEPTRRAVMQWSQQFLPEFEKAMAKRRCKLVFSAIEQYDNQAFNALIRPQFVRRRLPRYFLTRNFDVVTVHGRKPFAPRPLKSIRVSHATPNDWDELIGFLQMRSSKKPISLDHRRESWQRRIELWPNLTRESFLIARGVKNEILGCCLPWDPNPIQSYIPMRYHGAALTLKETMRIPSKLGWIRGLPSRGQPIHLKFLTQIESENDEVFFSMVDFAYNELEPDEVLCYAHFEDDAATAEPPGFITSEIPYALYTVLQPNDTLPEFLRPDTWRPVPQFELTFL